MNIYNPRKKKTLRNAAQAKAKNRTDSSALKNKITERQKQIIASIISITFINVCFISIPLFLENTNTRKPKCQQIILT